MIEISWFLLLIPLFTAVIGHFLLNKNQSMIALLSTLSSLICLLLAFSQLGRDAQSGFDWIRAGDYRLQIGILVDRLSSGMMIVVAGVGFLVNVFSLAYMKDDDAKGRYFSSLSFFLFSMTGIVMSSGFITTFIFWELVGLSSYLLIGHWFLKATAADAAKKAFLCNRVGDFGFLIGIMMLFALLHTLNFADLAHASDTFLAHTDHAKEWFSLMVLCLFCGAIGKSAQLPLHVWLPDAMEGPTPVSALIHAATMVAAGVYMMFRLQISIGMEAFHGLFASDVITWVGAVTSLVAALMATQQDDIKKILAYSTLSQLGYMIMAIGLVHGEAAMFHLYTHAWFKALLFLGSGAIIYACHHEQNIWKMGGLAKKMPVTTLTFGMGYMALIAVPYVSSGFWSKEEILLAAFHQQPVFIIAAFVALLTSFYMTRLFVVVFLGKTRSEESSHAHEVGWQMKFPLILLAVMALFSASFAIPKCLNAVTPEHSSHNSTVLVVSIATLLLGVSSSFLLYRNRSEDPLSIKLFKNKFYFDEFYQNYLVKYAQDCVAAVIHFIDELFINSLVVDGCSRVVQSFSQAMQRVQSGNLQWYVVTFSFGVLWVIYLVVF